MAQFVSCKDCPIGFYQDGDSPAKCLGCASGFHVSTKGAEKCQTCAAGTYQASIGQPDCTECNADTYGDLPAAAVAGFKSASDCSKCEAQKTTNGTTGATSSDACMCEKKTYLDPFLENCVKCNEQELDCDHFGVTLQNVIVRPGYWRRSNTSMDILTCLNEDDCIGGTFSTQCASNRGGVLCSVCFDGHVRIGGDCELCPVGQGRGGSPAAGVIVATGIPCLLLFFGFIYYFGRREKKDSSSKKTRTKILPETATLHSSGKAAVAKRGSKAAVQDEARGKVEELGGDTTTEALEEETLRIALEAATYLATASTEILGRSRILVGFMQIMNGLVSGFDIPWPPMFLSIIGSLSLINFDFVRLLGGLDACALYSPYLMASAFHMAILPFMASMITVAALVAKVVLRNDSHVVMKRAKGAMLELIMLLYPGIVTKVFSAFKCRTIDGVSYLMADYGVLCDSNGGEWVTVTTSIMYPAMLVYVIGIPLGIVVFLKINSKLLYTTDNIAATKFQSIYGGLYQMYDEKYFYFESIVLLQKALLTGGLVLVAPGSSVSTFFSFSF